MKKNCFGFLFIFPLVFFLASALHALEITDDLGRVVDVRPRPARVVSLSPAATEIIVAIGADKALKGVSTEDGHFAALIGLPAVGTPALAPAGLVAGLRPDLLIVEPALAQEALSGKLAGSAPVLVLGGPSGLAQAEGRLAALGALFGRSREARAVQKANRDYFDVLALKTSRTGRPAPRVMRILARDGRLATPGSLSFQNDIIRAAGGQAPDLAATADEVPIGAREVALFDPEIIFACGRDREALEAFLAQAALGKVSAVRNRGIRYYPCALTDRAAAHAGYFAAWLSSALFAEQYGNPQNLARPNEVVGQRKIRLDMPFVAQARVVDARLNDYIQKTLVIDFKTPQAIISTSDGPMDGVAAIGNGSSPPMVWDINHQGGWEADLAARLGLLGLDPASSGLIFTGADLDGLAIVTKRHRDMTVTALATAGAESNAVRTSRDVGAYYQPGTINVIVLSSRRLSPAGAARALVTVTEAKTAAVWDLDVRSSQTPLANPATGTGTDSVIIVAGGEGEAIDYTGGHARIGQIMAEAVHEAVLEALALGNGLAQGRHVFARLSERGLEPLELFTGPDAGVLASRAGWRRDLVEALLDPRYAGLVESALALDDARGMGHLSDGSAFLGSARAAASGLAGGRDVAVLLDLARPDLPPMLKTALDAIGTGVAERRP
ncbi:MAG: adenosylcobinamide amidohydrolase [Deltaproteobacteria bacterium]|jgi:adenosylcobinamide amidohydrolase/ABC-type Fe3+-hydroxamate transport system substrate-binding protein|nr:adenosylcobinamide amidohydrolase [Deltaproteobacteria bacterium]